MLGDNMKRMIASCISKDAMVRNAVLAVITSLAAVFAEAAQQPNIILVLADDIGISGISCYGSDSFTTPHIDRLAVDGMQFNYAFSTPVCGPSRVCLMTGRYPFRTGGLTNGSSLKVSPLKEVAFPRLLKEAGYATFATGKWPWLGHRDKPDAWGFDETLLWDDRHTTDRYWDPNLYDNGEKKSFPGGYGPDVMQDAIFDFVDRVREGDPGKPFFAYYASALPHMPMIHTPDSKSADIPVSEKYRDMVLYMDKQIGDLREQLEERDLVDNTLIIFTGDNGSIAQAKEVINGKQVLGGKAEMTDGGVRVPLICCWPGTITSGRKADHLVDFSDFFPTLLDIAGVERPANVQLDGKSFAPLLREQDQGKREWVFYQIGKNYAVRDHKWKLNQKGILFDMRQGIHIETPVDPNTDPKTEAAYEKLNAALVKLRLPQHNKKLKATR